MRIVDAAYNLIGKFAGMSPGDVASLKDEAQNAYGKLGMEKAKPMEKKAYGFFEHWLTRTVIALTYILGVRWFIRAMQAEDDDEDDWENKS